MKRFFEAHERKIAIASVVLLVVFMLPVWYLGRYNYPWADDYSNSYRVYHAWLETKSVWATLRTAMSVAKESYLGWQGTFSSVFLMVFRPGIMHYRAYMLTPVIMTTMLLGSVFCLVYNICNTVLKIKKCASVIMAAAFALVIVQTMPSPVTAYYWWTGSVHYVFMQSVFLLLTAVILGVYGGGSISVLKLLTGVMLAVIVGGGNLVTALLMVLVLPIIGILFFLYDKNKVYAVKAVAVIWTAGLIAFGLNVFAPGNSIRQTRYEKPAMGWALREAMRNAAESLRIEPAVWIVLIMAAPVIWEAMRRNRTGIKLPVLSLCGIAGCYLAAYLPGSYSGYGYPDRMLNALFVIKVFVFLLAEIILIGVCANHQAESDEKWSAQVSLIWGWAVLMVFFVISYRPDSGNQPVLTNAAIYSIIAGDAAAYGEVMAQRYRIMMSDERVVEVPAAKAEPYLIAAREDLWPQEDWWVNVGWCLYFDKDSIVTRDYDVTEE